VREPFSAAMSQSILLPAFIALFGIVAALFLVSFTASATTREGGSPRHPPEYGGGSGDDDDDEYVEYILLREPDVGEAEGNTEALQTQFRHPRPPPADARQSLLDEPVSAPQAEPIGFAHNRFHVDSGQRFRPIAQFSPPAVGPTRHDHPFASPSARRQTGSEGAHARSSGNDSSARHELADGEPPRNKHDRADPEDRASGRRSR
jgi:hypothetical protein